MPRRTNTFQRVVAILHEHMAGDAQVVESAMLTNRVTGEEREVDVVIRSTVAGHEMVLGIEATMKKGSSPWVEQMIGKHADLPTDRLVLVAERGFSAPARRYAAQKGIALITPEDLKDADPALKIVSRLERVWPKGVALTPEQLRIIVKKPDGTMQRVRDIPPDAVVYLGDGRIVGNPWHMFKALFESQFPRLAEMIGLPDITDDRDEFFVLELGKLDEPWGLLRYGGFVPLYLRWELAPEPEMHQIYVMEYTGRAVINIAEVRLTHRRFDESMVAYGEAPLGGQDALFVITEDAGGAQMSIRVGPDRPSADASADEYSQAGYGGADDEDSSAPGSTPVTY